ncbi:MAG: aminotransferase class III-fold pyridoxal phosphate-dependent enzyme, partial [Planctomycetota bacterium]
MEVAALQSVFDAGSDRRQYCAIGSVKSNIGHTVAAAGAAGLIKVALAMHHETLPATLHYKSPNPQIDFENSPFFVCESLRSWGPSETPRRAGVSSFGVGGTNAHLILEEAPPRSSTAPKPNQLPLSIFPISAKTQAALEDQQTRFSRHLADHSINEGAVASALQLGRESFRHRTAIVAGSREEVIEALASRRATAFTQRKASASPRELVFMFPGQGAQYIRMGQNLYQHSQVFREHLDRCSEILRPALGRDLREILYPAVGSEEASQEILKNTRFTQPALFSIGYALAEMWSSWGIRPCGLIGHSIGEFAAACFSGVFELEDGLQIIAERGRAMQDLPSGSMMSVRLPGKDVEPLLWGDLAVASFNGPSLCVVSGPDDLVDQLRDQLESEDVVCRLLHTSHAFHSPMMDSIVDPFARFVSKYELQAPRIPILSTVTGAWLSDQEARDPMYWAKHLRAPVRFSDAVHAVWDSERGDPTRVLIELGPRKTLATLAKQHAQDPKQQISIPTLSDTVANNAEWHSTLGAIAQLWTSGVNIDWSKLSTDGSRVSKPNHVSIPTYAFERERYFIEPGNDSRGVQTKVDSPFDAIDANEDAALPDTPLRHTEVVNVNRIDAIVARVQSIFEETSGFDLTEFDEETTFFEMGLDSLVLTQTASALQKQFKVEITFRQLLEETSSVAMLAEWFDELLPSDQFVAVESSAAENQISAQPAESQTASSTDLPCVEHQQQKSVARCANESPVGLDPQQRPNAVAAFSDGGGIESVVQMQLQAQLQLMQQQLQALGASQASTTEKRSEMTVSSDVSKPPRTTPVFRSVAEVSSPAESDDQELAPKAKRFKTVKLTDNDLTEVQQKALDEIIRMNNVMMPRSKAYAQEHRKYLADPRTVSGFRPNMKEMTHPIVIDRSKGAELWDLDGNRYIDFTCGFGSNLLGHTHEITVKAVTDQINKDYAIGPQSPLAGEVARLFCQVTGSERMAFSNTGSEAVLGCTRLARNAT